MTDILTNEQALQAVKIITDTLPQGTTRFNNKRRDFRTIKWTWTDPNKAAKKLKKAGIDYTLTSSFYGGRQGRVDGIAIRVPLEFGMKGPLVVAKAPTPTQRLKALRDQNPEYFDQVLTALDDKAKDLSTKYITTNAFRTKLLARP